MIRRYAYGGSTRQITIDIADHIIPTEVELAAGRALIHRVLPPANRHGQPFETILGNLDFSYYVPLHDTAYRGNRRIPGNTWYVERGDSMPFLSVVRTLGEVGLAGWYGSKAPILGDITFMEDLPDPVDTPAEFDHLDLSYILAASGDIRLLGGAHGIVAGSRTADLLESLKLTLLTGFGPNYGVLFKNEPMGLEQIDALATYIDDHNPR